MTKHDKKVVDSSKEGYAYHIRPSDEDIDRLISLMKKNATIQPMVELGDRNWMNCLDTPIGLVKLGENQREKLISNGRTGQYGMMVATLTDPCIILEDRDAIYNPTHQRDCSFLFVKTFEKEDKSKFIHFESVTVAQDELEVVISSHIIREGQLKKKMKNDRLLYKATALDTTAIISAGQSVNKGGSPSSYDKDSEQTEYGQKFDKKNDVEQKNRSNMNINQDTIFQQYEEMKKKHPDTIILFRVGDFYEMRGQDAVEASKILGISITRSMNGNTGAVELAGFPHHALDKYLPNLVRAGKRVAICEQLEDPKQKKVEKESKETLSNSTDMARKKKEQAPEQEQPKAQAEKKTEAKAEVKPEAKPDAKTEQKQEAQQERKPREPQMVTVNGDKVTHGHAFQSKANPGNWYFTAKINGEQLKPQKMTPEDLAAFRNKEVTVPRLMERYYPTKLMEKVPEKAFKIPIVLAGPNGNITIDKFNVYKQKNEQSPDVGKYKFYAQIGETKMSTLASPQDLNAYFDRVMTPARLVEKIFGERLHLSTAYAHLQPPAGMKEGAAKVHKVAGDDKAWYISAGVNKDISTKAVRLSSDDAGSFFAKAVTADQLAGKYLQEEFKAALNKASSMSQGEEISKSMKI